MNSDKKLQLDILLKDGKVQKTNSLYYVNERESSLIKNANQITESLIEKYFENIIPVVNYLDPYLEFNAEEVSSRRLLGTEKIKYSEELRKSTFETLLTLKNNSSSFSKTCSNGFIENRAGQIITEALEKNATDWRFWCTNNEYLPMIALIAPNAYMKTIEEISKDETLLKNLKDALLNVRWLSNDWLNDIRYSLKLLAYYEDYFAKVISCFIDLAIYDDDENRNENRCCTTIVNIINPYRPSTLYPSEDIPDVILGILKRKKKYKHEILKELLPHKRNSFCSFELPKWVPQRNLVNKTNTSNEIDSNYLIAFKKYILAYLKDSSSFGKMIELINELPYFLDSFNCNDTEIITSIKEKLMSNLKISKRKRILVWESLIRAKLRTSKVFSNIYDAAIEKYKPDDAMAKCLLYFDNGSYELIGRHVEDYAKKEQELQREALSAIEIVYKEKGIESIFTIAEEAKYPLNLASFMPQTTFKDTLLDNIAKKIQLKNSSDMESFINEVIYTHSCTENLATLLTKLKYEEQKETEKLKIALAIKPNKEIWGIIQGKNEINYWKKIKLDRYYDWSLEEYEHCITRLNSVKRQRDSVSIAATALYRKIHIGNDTLFKLLESLSTTSKQPLNSHESQNIEKIILHLQEEKTDTFRVAMVELKYIAIFEKWRKNLHPDNLIKIIGKEPKYFCEIYDQRLNGNNNYQLYRILHDFHIKPGLNGKNKVTKKSLKTWIDYVEKHYSDDEKELESVRYTIGQNLAPSSSYSPVSDEAILDFLENNKQDNYYSGFLVGISGSRGVVHVDEKHTEEKQLNKIWLNAATNIEKRGFINVAELFRKAAKSFLDDARRIDEFEATRNAGTI